MPNGDPRDGFFYPTLTLMVDSYIVSPPLGFCLRNLSLIGPVDSEKSVENVNRWTANYRLPESLVYSGFGLGEFKVREENKFRKYKST